jgi:hypothetical protein
MKTGLEAWSRICFNRYVGDTTLKNLYDLGVVCHSKSAVGATTIFKIGVY